MFSVQQEGLYSPSRYLIKEVRAIDAAVNVSLSEGSYYNLSMIPFCCPELTESARLPAIEKE